MSEERRGGVVDPVAVHAGHVERVGRLDPLIGTIEVLEATEGDVLVDAVVDGGQALGRARLDEIDPASEGALWGALRSHRLGVQVAGTDVTGALAALLERWEAHLANVVVPGDVDTAATVTVPSRDVALALPLTLHGFAPSIVVAARPSRTAPEVTDPRVRAATMADLDALTAMTVATNAYDAHFGMVMARPAAAQVLGAALARQLDVAPGWTWIAEIDGAPAGFVQVQPPEESEWIAPLVAARSVAYLGYAYVQPTQRASGIGAALVAVAHHTAAAAGCDMTVLHHSLPNPLSTPFWGRMGYRPVWTMWSRRPALARR